MLNFTKKIFLQYYKKKKFMIIYFKPRTFFLISKFTYGERKNIHHLISHQQSPTDCSPYRSFSTHFNNIHLKKFKGPHSKGSPRDRVSVRFSDFSAAPFSDFPNCGSRSGRS